MTNCFRQLPLPEFPTSWWEIWRLVKLAPALISAWVEITRDHAIQGMSRFFPFIFQPFSTLSLKTEISQFHVSVSWSTFYNTTMIVTRYFNFLGGLPLSLVELCRISANLQLAVNCVCWCHSNFSILGSSKVQLCVWEAGMCIVICQQAEESPERRRIWPEPVLSEFKLEL